jgi:hypothetical protein
VAADLIPDPPPTLPYNTWRRPRTARGSKPVCPDPTPRNSLSQVRLACAVRVSRGQLVGWNKPNPSTQQRGTCVQRPPCASKRHRHSPSGQVFSQSSFFRPCPVSSSRGRAKDTLAAESPRCITKKRHTVAAATTQLLPALDANSQKTPHWNCPAALTCFEPHLLTETPLNATKPKYTGKPTKLAPKTPPPPSCSPRLEPNLNNKGTATPHLPSHTSSYRNTVTD